MCKENVVNMSSGVNRDIVRRWVDALDAVDQSRLGDAQRILWDIRDFSAKIWYNLAILHILEGDYKAADAMLQECLQKDGYLAIAQFQRGVIACQDGRLQEAKELFRSAQKNVRTGDMIDYWQLGLAVRLTLQQIEHNLEAVEAYLTGYNRGIKKQNIHIDIRHQNAMCSAPKYHVLSTKMPCTQQMSVDKLQTMPPCLFRPAKGLVDNLQKQQFLKKAKVVSAVPPIDQDTAARVRPQSHSAPTTPTTQRRQVPAVLHLETHTPPPPTRPPPRLPPTATSTHPAPSHPVQSCPDPHRHHAVERSDTHRQPDSSAPCVAVLPQKGAVNWRGLHSKGKNSESGPVWPGKKPQTAGRGGGSEMANAVISADCEAADDKPAISGGVAAMIRKLDSEGSLGLSLQSDSQRSAHSSGGVSRQSHSPKPVRPPPPQFS